MKSVELSVVTAMDGVDQELFPYLPFIFQDVWEIGSDSETIIKIIGRHFKRHEHLEILDAGCGKGAVCVKAARSFKCKCHGIDAVPEFISFAREKAAEFKVERLCEFEVGDIREKIKESNTYDVIVLGAIGPVFGDYFETLSILSKHLNDSGMIIIDDGYIDDDSDYAHPFILKKQVLLRQINTSGMRLVENNVIKRESVGDSNDAILKNLRRRCVELIERHPGKKDLFEGYIRRQEAESDVLENKVVCSILVLKEC
ncbi:MAG: class I SAM-dependent methyltransferase [Leptospiraceae bacterium]|nr:class I SAM-dependent methyltransferase [Leptospiraceae bacterium]